MRRPRGAIGGRVAIAAAAALLLAVPAAADGRASEPQPRIQAVIRPARVPVGGLLTVEVAAVGLRNAGAVSFHLVYDPSRLEPVPSGFGEGALFKERGARTRFLARPAATGDRVIVGLTRLGNGRGAEGAGVVARLVFKSLAPGKATVAFDRGEVTDPRARPTPARFLPGDVFVLPVKNVGRGR